MRVDYSCFGDVITFDTTYRNNKNYRPLRVFTSFNNHHHMVVFAVALLYDKTIESFTWLLETLLII